MRAGWMSGRRWVVVAMLLSAGGGAIVGSSTLAAPARQPAVGAGMQPRIATIDMLAVVERLVLSDKYAPARDTLIRETNAGIEPVVAQMKDVEGKFAALKQDAPDYQQQGQALQAEYGQLQQQLQQTRDAGGQALERLNVAQLSEAYRLVLDAADGLASRLGYSHLIASRTGAPTFRSQDVTGIVQEMLARTILKTDPADDLTQRLIAELKLEGVQVDAIRQAVPAGVPAAQPAQDPAPAPAPVPPK